MFLEAILLLWPLLMHVPCWDEAIMFIQFCLVMGPIRCQNSFPDAIVSNDVTSCSVPSDINVHEFSSSRHMIGPIPIPYTLHSSLPHRLIGWWHLRIISGDYVSWSFQCVVVISSGRQVCVRWPPKVFSRHPTACQLELDQTSE